jgi:signal peptidase
VRKVAKNFGWAVVILFMTAAAFFFLAPRFGWRADAVFSGSMEPGLKVGSVVVTRPVAAEEIKAGDIITFYSPLNEKLMCHRVVAAEHGSGWHFQTKGDANDDADPFVVPAESVVGKVCFHLPYFGYVNQFVKTRLGLLLTICIPGLVIIVMEIRNIRRVLNEEKMEKKYGTR